MRAMLQRECACGAGCNCKKQPSRSNEPHPPASTPSRGGHSFSLLSVFGRNGDDIGTPGVSDAATPASAENAADCAHPVNFTASKLYPIGEARYRAFITWGSSTKTPAKKGYLEDLSHCQIQERVDYPKIPNPPFDWQPDNPFYGSPTNGREAGTVDTHSYPPGIGKLIKKPGTFVATQVYTYKCDGANCAKDWTTFPGQSYEIKREVYAEGKNWFYRFSKKSADKTNPYEFVSDPVSIP